MGTDGSHEKWEYINPRDFRIGLVHLVRRPEVTRKTWDTQLQKMGMDGSVFWPIYYGGRVPEAWRSATRDDAKGQRRPGDSSPFADPALVALTGSPSEVCIASQIRSDFVKGMSCQLLSHSSGRGKRLTRVLIVAVNSFTEARWWIENRDVLAKALDPVFQQELRRSGL